MDVRNWPMDQVMQLPDHCFGRRWPIFFSGFVDAGVPAIQISRLALPERCVLWELWIIGRGYGDSNGSQSMTFGFRLADHLPAALEFVGLENMFPGSEEVDVTIGPVVSAPVHLVNLRIPYHSAGRRVVIDRITVGFETMEWSCGLVFSSVPREIPDCLISGNLRSR